MFGTQRIMNQQQAINADTQQRERQREQENTKEVQQGTVTRDFQFEKQKESVEQILQKPRSQEYLVAHDMMNYKPCYRGAI